MINRFETQAYKGYLIQYGLDCKYRVLKDGTLICTCDRFDQATASIDLIA